MAALKIWRAERTCFLLLRRKYRSFKLKSFRMPTSEPKKKEDPKKIFKDLASEMGKINKELDKTANTLKHE